ncbi:MAG TPA: hypothetical protein VFC67_26040, partial [Prolixibacteraceae bacterium]|nr:hypothetical protein [Prolixibacteraceae bacterium]
FKFLTLIFILSGCEDKYTEQYLSLEPVYMSYKDFREAVKVESTHSLLKPGKIYYKDNYLFINEIMKGIHVYNNTNPASPQYVGFISIPGNVDMVIKGNIMYADSYIDLVGIDITNPAAAKEVARLKSVFPYSVPPYESYYRLGPIDDTQGVVVDWTVKKVRKEIEQISYPVYPVYFGSTFTNFSLSADAASNGAQQASPVGIGGSMARFGLIGDHLVAVDNSTYYNFDLTNATSPALETKLGMSWGIETMFLSGSNMFLGTSNGMLIYNVADVTKPTYVSNFWHATGCDPVVVQNNRAYVTIRGGNACGSLINRMDILDITNLQNPTLMRSYNMTGPYGLGIDGDVLFVCDGTDGLKVYNAADPYLISEHLIATFKDINAYDVIPLGNSLLMIGSDGFYQYNYSNLNDIKQISSIKVVK